MNTQNIGALWAHLHWLTMLAEQGTYTAAAARLGVSKAAMSQRISELERAAGISLVQRTTRSVRLTEAGQQLVDSTREQYAQIATSFARVRDLSGIPRGPVRVTAPVAFARQQLIPKLPHFLAANPEVRVQLEVSDRLMSLATEGFDLAIRHTSEVPETHVAWSLCATCSVIVASRAYLRRRGTPKTPEDLASHDCLFYPRTTGEPAWSFERKGTGRQTVQPVSLPVTGQFSANNSELLRDAALEGLGIALVPDFTAQAAVQAGKLIVVLPDWRVTGAFSEHLHIIRPYASHVPRAVGLFVEYIRTQFADGFKL